MFLLFFFLRQYPEWTDGDIAEAFRAIFLHEGML